MPAQKDKPQADKTQTHQKPLPGAAASSAYGNSAPPHQPHLRSTRLPSAKARPLRFPPMNTTTQNTRSPTTRTLPACVGAEEAAAILGWPLYFFPVLMRTGHLKPLGKPIQNARKWFATVELRRLGADAAWLDKAIRIVEKHVQASNRKQRSRLDRPAAPQAQSNATPPLPPA
jgi:hypothetical protein